MLVVLAAVVVVAWATVVVEAGVVVGGVVGTVTTEVVEVVPVVVVLRLADGEALPHPARRTVARRPTPHLQPARTREE
ncbi:MAG: hypothetical protein ACRDYC_03430 [Acidimicrobiales bacterium]